MKRINDDPKTTDPWPQHKLDGWDRECVVCGCKWMEEAGGDCPQCAMKDKPPELQTTEAQPYMHADYLAEVWQAYPTAGALIEWQQQEIERLRTTEFQRGAEAMRTACIAIVEPVGAYSATVEMQTILRIRTEIEILIRSIELSVLDKITTPIATAAEMDAAAAERNRRNGG